MRNLYVALLFLATINSIAQIKISGTVKDKNTKEPLLGASIFAPNTTNGGATDENGYFNFTLIENQPEVIISYVGYESVLVPASSLSDPDKSNVIYLSPIISRLKEVVIKKTSPKQQQEYLDIFKRDFIGLSTIAQKTEILNPKVLQFDMNAEKTILTATADVPLVLLNEKTGYKISYELVYFESKVLQGHFNERITTYSGYPYFKDIVGEHKLNPEKVAETRLKCYKGSTMHFIRSLHNKSCDSEGFSMKKFRRISNPEYPSTPEKMEAFKRNAYKLGKSFHIPRYLDDYDKFFSKEDDLVFEKDNKKYIYFPDYVSISYSKDGEDPEYGKVTHTRHPKHQYSHLQLIEDKPVEIYSNGNYANPEVLGNFGYMGWRKMGDMLPFDYQPPSE
ncbi:carboxypeptidase-like regulatory domain-containing protein [Flavobacterium enshiense]|uniref:carboxypeptidase-like regulatory domain-containing protein n=1 Tax=Flavobacterium enshiense TaxID=1341165 RepID=UPI00345D0CAF